MGCRGGVVEGLGGVEGKEEGHYVLWETGQEGAELEDCQCRIVVE